MDDELQVTIKTLNDLIWEGRLPWTDVERWLSQFTPLQGTGYSEQLHALFLLSKFSYFNATLMRKLLRALFHDFIQHPIITNLRRRRRHTLDWNILEPHYTRALNRLRFIGIGNPSESGTHLLYYFRQENRLPTNLFIHPHELFEGTAAAPRLVKGIRQLVFLDDFCGSGTQAIRYSKRLLARIRELSDSIKLSYYPLFATTKGLGRVRSRTLFTNVQALCELDESFRSLDARSRYFRDSPSSISREFAKEMCQRHGDLIEPRAPFGFGECQLLFGFSHNIPNNTLPIFWSTGSAAHQWNPIFPRYTKGAGW
jgi:hypothetical protein